MSALATPFVTPEQYLKLERFADFKSEYHSGQMFAMAGGSPEHSAIGTNIAGELRSRLRGTPCQVFNSDLRVTVMQSGLKTYPDVTVVCGEQHFHPLDQNSLINPSVIIEVLSCSTESYDRGRSGGCIRRWTACGNTCWCRRTRRAWSGSRGSPTGSSSTRASAGWTAKSGWRRWK